MAILSRFLVTLILLWPYYPLKNVFAIEYAVPNSGSPYISLDKLDNNGIELDIVQAPFNVFDRRLEVSGWLSKLKKSGILKKAIFSPLANTISLSLTGYT